MCTIRIVRSKRINKNTARSTINRAYECSRVEGVNDLSDLARFSIQFSWKRSVKGKNFILLLLLLLVFTFSIDPSYHFSRTDNDVSLFLKCILSIASRPSSPRNDSIPPPQEKSPCAVPNIHFCASLCASYYADVVEFLSNLFQILH